MPKHAGAVNGFENSRILRFETRDREQAAERMSAAHGSNVAIDFHGDPESFALDFAVAKFDAARLVRVKVTSWSFTGDLDNLVFFMAPAKGRASCGTSRRVNDASPNVGFAAHPGERVSLKVSHSVGNALYAPFEELLNRAEKLADISLCASLAEMPETVDLTAPHTMALSRYMGAVMGEMFSIQPGVINDLVRTGYEDTLLNLAAVSLFPQLAKRIMLPQADCGPSVIRKARDFIYAHAAEPVDLLKLATELGISMRAMQQNFRKHLGCSPRDYLMECRLEKVREQLLRSDGTVSVTGVAQSCGFPNHGYFSSKYREKYGELPSETLRRARANA